MRSPGRQTDAILLSCLICSLAVPAAAGEFTPRMAARGKALPARSEFTEQSDQEVAQDGAQVGVQPATEELPSFEGQLSRPDRWLDGTDSPPPTAPMPSPAPDERRPLRRFIWNWTPEGMIPYWGPRTPDNRKDRGLGGPLTSGGWRSQPFSISGFGGATNGGPIIRGHVDERVSSYAGANFGWDYDHYWGIEKRLGFGALNLTNANHELLSQTGLSVTGEYRIMYYPLGDSRWRPFFTAGLGWSDFYFYDDFHHRHIDTLFLFPYGVGLKYLWNDHWALRIDLIDELTLGGNTTSTFHYVALTAGLEFRYGKRLLHMPWHRKDGS